MKKPVLIIMVAGMGSRYGGLKQIDPVDEQGHIIMDFSLYDAVKAGFEKVIFILKRENEADFKEVIGDRISKVMQVEYVFQDTADLPAGFQMPEGRKKPWGTGHAVLSARKQVDGLLLLSMRTIITEEALFPKFMIILPLTEAAKLAKRASMIIPW